MQAREMTDSLVKRRAEYLSARASEIGACVEVSLLFHLRNLLANLVLQVNPNLADWFASDPVERIVNLENSLHSRWPGWNSRREGRNGSRSWSDTTYKQRWKKMAAAAAPRVLIFLTAIAEGGP